MEKWTMKYGQIWSERREGKGEDAEPLTMTYETKYLNGVMGVMDGMGGAGSALRQLPDGSSQTDAYLASRFVREKVKQWFEEHEPGELLKKEQRLELQQYLSEELNKYKEELGIQPSGLQGNMTRILPTTLAMIQWQIIDDGLFLNSIWAGDSRNYVLDVDGLHVLTRDHVAGDSDAWESLYNDPPLNNAICQNKEFQLDSILDAMRRPSVLISCTDGCFNYLPSPMHFEKMLIETFLDAEDMEDWMKRIKAQLLPIAGDDFSMAVLVNMEGWNELKDVLKERLSAIQDAYIQPFEALTVLEQRIPRLKRLLWQEYANKNFGKYFYIKSYLDSPEFWAMEDFYATYLIGKEDDTE